MSETAIRYDLGQESVSAGVAAHIERPAVEGSPLQHPSKLTSAQISEAYIDEVNTYLQAHTVEENLSKVESLISPEHTQRHHDLVDQALPDFKSTHYDELSYQILGQAIEIGREVIERPHDSRPASQRFNEAVRESGEQTSPTELLSLITKTIRTEGSAYSIGRTLAEFPELAVALTEHVKTEDVGGWDKAALYVSLDSAVTFYATKQSENSEWWTEPGESSPAVAETLVATDQTVTVLEKSRADNAMQSSGGEVPAYLVKRLIEQYSELATVGVSADTALTYENIQSSRWIRKDNYAIDADEIIDTVEAYRRASPEMVELIGTGDHDTQLLLALEPFTNKMEAGLEGSRLDKTRILELAALIGSSPIVEKGVAESRRKTLQNLVDQGVSVDSLIDLLRNSKNVDLIKGCVEVDPADAEAGLSQDLLVKMLGLPLYNEDNSERPNYYVNGQGLELDVRDSVIRTIVENPYSVKDHVELLSEKIPHLLESGFPTDLIAKSLLAEFNPSISANIRDKSFYEKNIDYCTLVGDGILPIKDFDSELAGWIIDGQYDEVIGGNAVPDVDDIKRLGLELSQIASSNSPVEAWLKEFSRNEISSVANLRELINIGRRFAADSELSQMAFSKIANSKLSTPEANILRLSAARLNGFEAVEQYFANCNTIRPVLQNENFSHFGILQNIANLDSGQTELLAKQLTSELVITSLEDPNLRSEINGSLTEVSSSPGTTDLDRGLTLYSQIANKDHIELNQIINGASEVVKNLPAGFDELYYSAISRIASSFDKDGNPYESVRTVTGVFKHLVPDKLSDQSQQAHAKELLSWYEQSPMPYVAMPAILTMRDEAIRAGVPNSAKEIYEWMFEGEARIASMSTKHLTDYVPKIKLKQGNKHDLESAQQEVMRRRDSLAVFVNVSEEALLKIATESEGRIKSMMDRVEMKNRGTNYGLFRSEIEIGLGLRSMDETIEHPVYGTCGFLDEDIPTGAEGYGEILMTFPMDSQLEKRTTFTPEDSFHGATRMVAQDAATVRVLKDRQGIGYTLTDDYVEAQVSGGLTIDEASQIIVPNEDYKLRLITQLPAKYHSKILVRPQNTRFVAA